MTRAFAFIIIFCSGCELKMEEYYLPLAVSPSAFLYNGDVVQNEKLYDLLDEGCDGFCLSFSGDVQFTRILEVYALFSRHSILSVVKMSDGNTVKLGIGCYADNLPYNDRLHTVYYATKGDGLFEITDHVAMNYELLADFWKDKVLRSQGHDVMKPGKVGMDNCLEMRIQQDMKYAEMERFFICAKSNGYERVFLNAMP